MDVGSPDLSFITRHPFRWRPAPALNVSHYALKVAHSIHTVDPGQEWLTDPPGQLACANWRND
jgi:hypothetical protein